MNTSEYRREFREYHAAVERERAARGSFNLNESDARPLRERYSDLWSADAIENLRTALRDTPDHLSTERTALGSLLSAASFEFISSLTGEINREIERCESRAVVTWEGQSLSARREALERLVRESGASRRGELDAKRLDALAPCADLRTARGDLEREGRERLGFRSLRELGESATLSDYRALAREAATFLEKGARVYETLLSVVRNAPYDSSRLTYADYLYGSRNAAQINKRLIGEAAFDALNATLAGLGMSLARQTNVRVDRSARGDAAFAAVCFPVNPPTEVVLAIGHSPADAAAAASLFHEAARAEYYAWNSRELSERYPEFIYSADRAVQNGYGCLFRSLLRNPLWVGECFGLRAEASGEFASAYAFLQAYEVRRAAAELIHGLAADDRAADGAADAEAAGRDYADIIEAATGFAHRPEHRLYDSLDLFGAASALRSWSFATGLGEHLRLRHGQRWWAQRGAADELIDYWNTAARHTAEELSGLIGFGANNLEMLVDDFKSVAAPG